MLTNILLAVLVIALMMIVGGLIICVLTLWSEDDDTNINVSFTLREEEEWRHRQDKGEL